MRQATRLSVTLTASAMLALAVSAYAAPSAALARTLSLSESAHLHSTGSQGFHLNETGSATGTIRGAIYIHLHIANNHDQVTAEVNIYPNGGSLTGTGSASYRIEGAFASFSGALKIIRGSGSYAGAHASNLRFSGTIERRNDAAVVKLSGSLTL